MPGAINTNHQGNPPGLAMPPREASCNAPTDPDANALGITTAAAASTEEVKVSFSKVIQLAEEVAAGNAKPESLAEYLHEFALSDVDLEQYCTWVDQAYTRNYVHKSDNVEILVLCWLGDVRTPPHDHGGSWGVVVPYQGEIANRLFERVSPNTVRETHRILQKRGDVLIIGQDDVHQVVSGEGDRNYREVSIHCYFPPIAIMNEFEEVSAEVPITAPKMA